MIYFYTFSALLNVFVLFFVSVILLISRKKTKVIYRYLIFNTALLGWAFFYFLWQISISYNTALLWSKMFMFSAIWLAPTFWHFAITVAGKLAKFRWFTLVSYLIFIPFSYLCFTSLNFITELTPRMGIRFVPVAGVYFYAFFVLWSALIVYAIIQLFKTTYSTKDPKARKVLKTLTYTILISFIAGSSNYALNFNIPIPPVTTAASCLFGLAVAILLLKQDFWREEEIASVKQV